MGAKGLGPASTLFSPFSLPLLTTALTPTHSNMCRSSPLPEKLFNLHPGDGVIIFRNIGGHVTFSIKDILALDGFVTVHDIVVIHHTDCGASHFKDPVIREGLKACLPEQKEIDEMSFGAFDDLEQSVRDDLNILRQSKYIRKELADAALGFVYDLKTGTMTAVHN